MKLQKKNITIGLILIIFAVLSGFAVLNATTSRLFSGISIFIVYVALFIGVLTKGIRSNLLFLIAFIGPFNINRYFVYNNSLNLWVGINVVDPLLVLLYAFWFLEKSAGRGSRINLFKDCALPLAGLLLAFLLSIVNSVDRIAWFYGTATLFRGILIFYYIANNVSTEKTLKTIIAILLIGLVFQSLIAVTQEWKGGVIGLKYLTESPDSPFQRLGTAGNIYRVTGTLPSHNLFCFVYLDFLIPLVLALLFLRLTIVARIIVSAIFIMTLFVFIFTLSRGGWLAVGAASVFLLLLYRKTKTFNARTLLLFFLIICLLSVPFIYMKDIILSRLFIDDKGAAIMRIPLARVALAVISAHPVLGIGTGNYLQVMHLYDVTHEGVTSFFPFPVHNIYLLIASEAGVFALALFLLFLFSVSKRAIFAIRRGDSFTSLVSLGLFSGLIAFGFHGFFESFPLGQIFMFWFVAGLIVSLTNIAETPGGL